jgi:hypothetical protein
MALRNLILEPKLPPKEVRRLEVRQPWISCNADADTCMLISDRWELPGMFIDEVMTVGFRRMFESTPSTYSTIRESQSRATGRTPAMPLARQKH